MSFFSIFFLCPKPVILIVCVFFSSHPPTHSQPPTVQNNSNTPSQPLSIFWHISHLQNPHCLLLPTQRNATTQATRNPQPACMHACIENTHAHPHSSKQTPLVLFLSTLPFSQTPISIFTPQRPFFSFFLHALTHSSLSSLSFGG